MSALATTGEELIIDELVTVTELTDLKGKTIFELEAWSSSELERVISSSHGRYRWFAASRYMQ